MLKSSLYTPEKRKHVVVGNIPNLVYPGQQFDDEIPHFNEYDVIYSNTTCVTCNVNVTSEDKNYDLGCVVEKIDLRLGGGRTLQTLNNDLYMVKEIKVRIASKKKKTKNRFSTL